MVYDLCIQPLKRQEHNSEACGVGRADVFVVDVFCTFADNRFEGFVCQAYTLRVAGDVSILKCGVCITREFRVYGQIDKLRTIPGGKLYRKFDVIPASGDGRDLGIVLVGIEDF